MFGADFIGLALIQHIFQNRLHSKVNVDKRRRLALAKL